MPHYTVDARSITATDHNKIRFGSHEKVIFENRAGEPVQITIRDNNGQGHAGTINVPVSTSEWSQTVGGWGDYRLCVGEQHATMGVAHFAVDRIGGEDVFNEVEASRIPELDSGATVYFAAANRGVKVYSWGKDGEPVAVFHQGGGAEGPASLHDPELSKYTALTIAVRPVTDTVYVLSTREQDVGLPTPVRGQIKVKGTGTL